MSLYLQEGEEKKMELSSWKSKDQLFPSISESSTISELLSVVHLSFEEKEVKEVETILVRREEDLQMEVRHLKREVENLKKERDLLEKLHGLEESEKMDMEKHLNNRQIECEELSDRVNRLMEEHKLLIDGKIRQEERHRKEMEEAKRVENEGKKKFEELVRKNEELEDEIMRYSNCYRRLLELEEKAASIAREDVSGDVGKGNRDDHNPFRSSPPVRSSTNSHGDDDPHHLDKEVCFADNRPSDVEVCDTKQAGNSPIVSAEGLNAPVIVINSDDETCAAGSAGTVKINDSFSDETSAAGSAGVAKIRDSDSNSSEKETLSKTSVTKNSSVKSKKVTVGVKDASIDSLNRRKRSLDTVVGNDRSAVSRQKTQKTEGIFHHDKGSPVNGCSTMYDLVAPRRLSFLDPLESSSTDSDDESAASTDIENAIANLRKKAWKSAGDMLSEIKRNDELCMKAVCALYRRIISAEKLTDDPSTPANPGFSHFIAMRGKDLAAFLINSDPRHRLRRSVAEMKEKCPGDLEKCRELAIQYNDKLFEIYCKGEDPFFCAFS